MEPDGYAVRHECECTLIYGAVLADDFAALTNSGRGAHWFMDSDAARVTGATLVFGPRAGLDALKSKYAPRYESVVAGAYIDRGFSVAAVKWLATGEQGRSSLAVFLHLIGADLPTTPETKDCTDHPHDPSDMRRCLLLLEAVPELVSRLGRMCKVSPQWAVLFQHWDELVRSFESEVPNWRQGGGQAPRTYALMTRLINGVTQPHAPDRASRDECSP